MNALPNSASLIRRAAAIVYDALAAAAVTYFASFIPVLASGGSALEPGNPAFLVYVIGTVYAYFGLCWTRGRTLGMQAWKLGIVTDGGQARLSWGASLVRFAAAALSAAALGLGYLWALFDSEGRTWHDRLSGSRVVRRTDV